MKKYCLPHVFQNAKGRSGRIVNIHATDIVSTRHAIDLTEVACMGVKMGNNVTGVFTLTLLNVPAALNR